VWKGARALALKTGGVGLARVAIENSENRFRHLAETASTGLHWIDSDATILWANQAELDLLGYTAAEYIGHKINEFHVDAAVLDDILTRLSAGERLREYEARLLAKDGSVRHVIIDSIALFEKQKFIHTQCFTRDITQRKQTEQALRESEERFRALVNASSYVVYRMSADWKEMRELDGRGFIVDTREARSNWIEIYIHPDDQPLLSRTIRHAIETKSVFELEHRVRRVDGTLGWTFSRAVPLLDKDGNIVEWFGAASDVTTRVKAQEARLRLAAIVESSDDAIVSKDLNGIVTSWNRQAEHLFGYKEEEMIGRSILTIIPPELRGDEDMILDKIRSGQKIDHFETVRVAKSGERIDVSLSISPVRDDHGQVVGAAKIARDIRENKKIQKALRTTEKLAAAGRLAATVAHEINNPVEVISNLIYLAQRDLPNTEKVALYLKSAKQELNRVAHITRQTLGFYRETSSPVWLNVTTELDDLLVLYARRFETRNIKVVKQYENGAEIFALGGEIRQAFSNLLGNAMDAMPSGGTLALRVRKAYKWTNAQDPGVRITIADSGTGIAQEHRQNLFQPFFTTKADVGTGLGLWILRGIIEKHGGSIYVKSQIGDNHGTTFSIFLPIRGNSIGSIATTC
jgi:PAS domain S-box-containing protein